MRLRTFPVAVVTVAALVFFVGTVSLKSQTPAPSALSGQVASTQEGPMEGVLVNA